MAEKESGDENGRDSGSSGKNSEKMGREDFVGENPTEVGKIMSDSDESMKNNENRENAENYGERPEGEKIPENAENPETAESGESGAKPSNSPESGKSPEIAESEKDGQIGKTDEIEVSGKNRENRQNQGESENSVESPESENSAESAGEEKLADRSSMVRQPIAEDIDDSEVTVEPTREVKSLYAKNIVDPVYSAELGESEETGNQMDTMDHTDEGIDGEEVGIATTDGEDMDIESGDGESSRKPVTVIDRTDEEVEELKRRFEGRWDSFTEDGEINYRKIVIPDDKFPHEYTYPERRAEIYRMIERRGHPKNLEYTQRELADRYGVDRSAIWTDIKNLKEFEKRNVGRDEEANTSFLATRAIEDALDNKEYEKAFNLQLEYYEWLFSTGAKEKAADKKKLDIDAETAWRAMMDGDMSG